MSFIGTFIVGENNIVCRQGRMELRGIPAGRWDVIESTAYTWRLSAPGYGDGQDEGDGPLYLSKERYGKDLPREFVSEPRPDVDLVREIMGLGGDSQAHMDEALRVYLNRLRVIREWAEAAYLDGHDEVGVIPGGD